MTKVYNLIKWLNEKEGIHLPPIALLRAKDPKNIPDIEGEWDKLRDENGELNIRIEDLADQWGEVELGRGRNLPKGANMVSNNPMVISIEVITTEDVPSDLNAEFLSMGVYLKDTDNVDIRDYVPENCNFEQLDIGFNIADGIYIKMARLGKSRKELIEIVKMELKKKNSNVQKVDVYSGDPNE